MRRRMQNGNPFLRAAPYKEYARRRIFMRGGTLRIHKANERSSDIKADDQK